MMNLFNFPVAAPICNKQHLQLVLTLTGIPNDTIVETCRFKVNNLELHGFVSKSELIAVD